MNKKLKFCDTEHFLNVFPKLVKELSFLRCSKDHFMFPEASHWVLR